MSQSIHLNKEIKLFIFFILILKGKCREEITFNEYIITCSPFLCLGLFYNVLKYSNPSIWKWSKHYHVLFYSSILLTNYHHHIVLLSNQAHFGFHIYRSLFSYLPFLKKDFVILIQVMTPLYTLSTLCITYSLHLLYVYVILFFSSLFVSRCWVDQFGVHQTFFIR